jgi:hypothetical protein
MKILILLLFTTLTFAQSEIVIGSGSLGSGSLIVTANVNSISLNTNNIFLIGYNLYPTARECAFASIGEGMTDIQANVFYNIVQQFQTMLSRQI